MLGDELLAQCEKAGIWLARLDNMIVPHGKITAELWPVLKANKAALLRAIGRRDRDLERVFDNAMDWREYANLDQQGPAAREPDGGRTTQG